MAKLYPPYLEGTLPAFWLDDSGGGTMTIPFALNKANSLSDINVSNVAAKFKTVQNDVLLGAVTIADWGGTLDLDKYEVRFPVTGNKLNDIDIKIGQFYKVQLAFMDENNVIGYYSTVGVVKCTAKPDISIQGMSANEVNNNSTEFIGVYKQTGDPTEKVYSSNFVITDLQGNEIENTGDVLHNVENNPNSYTSNDSMYFNRDLNFGEIYKIVYTITTNNGLVESSPTYLITQQKSLQTDLKGDLIAELDYDEGFVDVRIEGSTTLDGSEEIISGMFVLAREDALNPGVWEEMTRFSLKHEFPTKTIFRDFTIEQGKTYTYSLQQYNSMSIYSDRKKSNTVYADFEDMFLFDGERQLKLRFNPQVSNFKTQLAETRTETIGSKYPFFYRNARIGYKVFPVSGLVSMLTDDNEFFITFDEILREDFIADRHQTEVITNKKVWPEVYNHINLLSENFTSERLFKLQVLDWLNNGRVKLFKSPGEGNYLVRMMDTSMSPNTTVGRMLHTVNSTAYECAAYTHANMRTYGIIDDIGVVAADNTAKVTNWREKSLSNLSFSNNPKVSNNLLDKDDAPYTTILRFVDLMPGTRIELVFNTNGAYIENPKDPNQAMILTIGATGSYYADDIQPVYGIYILNPYYIDGTTTSIYYPSNGGSVTYQYETTTRTNFDSIEKTQTSIGGYNQFIGPVDDVIAASECTRGQVTKICMSNYYKRPVEYLYYTGNDFSAGSDTIFLGRDSDGYRTLRNDVNLNNLYWDLAYNPEEKFNDKDSMEYSPFSLYVIKNSGIGGYKPTHTFEKYYVDRIINAESAEDELTAYCLLYAKSQDESLAEEERAAAAEWLAQNAMYVVDAWTGEIFKAGATFSYSPIITYNGEEIDLREIDRYSLDDLEPVETSIAVGNGVYGELFYQQVTLEYSFEESISAVKIAKDNWITQHAKLQALINKDSGTTSNWPEVWTAMQAESARYAEYNKALANAIEEWTKLEE